MIVSANLSKENNQYKDNLEYKKVAAMAKIKKNVLELCGTFVYAGLRIVPSLSEYYD